MPGLSRSVFGPNRGLFAHRKHPKYASIVVVKPSNMRKTRNAVKKLESMFRGAKTDSSKRLIKQATVEAANIAQVSARRTQLKPLTRERYHTIEKLYRKASEEMAI